MTPWTVPPSSGAVGHKLASLVYSGPSGGVDQVAVKSKTPGETAAPAVRPRSTFREVLLEVRPRLRAYLKFKSVAIPLFIAIFFAAYFAVLKFPLFPVAVMPLTALDRIIPFWPGALLLYISLWVYVPLVFPLLRERGELFAYGATVTATALVGLGIFVVCPTGVPAPEIDWEQYPTFIFLKEIDATGNACPSLHVAFAIFTALWLHRLLRELGVGGFIRVLNWCWCAGILYSTVATKQHVVLDVIAGVALGIGGWALGKWRPLRARMA
jgi:membrane-associated phospholipid phosphatase